MLYDLIMKEKTIKQYDKELKIGNTIKQYWLLQEIVQELALKVKNKTMDLSTVEDLNDKN